jgi:hypothetical protein
MNKLQERFTNLKGVKVRVVPEHGGCPVCEGAMKVQKTGPRQGKTLSHGEFEAWETVEKCAAGCRHPSGELVTRRATMLMEVFPPRRVAGYDVIVFVGIKRYLEHWQREEIRAALETEYGIRLSSGEVSNLERLFLDYLLRLHKAHINELRAVIDSDGGTPWHIDATGEDGRGTLFVVLAGWRRWVLGAWKLPTERADAILPCLREVAIDFGAPCAIVRDLGHAMSHAVVDFLEEKKLKIPILACHAHFLKDIGGDLLKPSHDALRDTFRTLKLRPQLRLLARDLGRKLGSEVEGVRQKMRAWMEEEVKDRTLPKGSAGIGAVRSIAQWVLDYKADSSGDDFPFDRPYHDLYVRCTLALKGVNGFLESPSVEEGVLKALKRLRNILAPVECDLPLRQHSRYITERARIFDELRSALRLTPSKSKVNPPEAAVTTEELSDIRKQVESLIISLKSLRNTNIANSDIHKAISIIIRHIDKHGSSLWGHELTLPSGETRLADRTNNYAEGFFRDLKHDERRRSGRKVLTQDFEFLPPEAALARNLRRDDYLKIVCGSIDQLHKSFSQLDALARAERLSGKCLVEKPQRPVEISSASLSTPDRRLVRVGGMRQRLQAAAQA